MAGNDRFIARREQQQQRQENIEQVGMDAARPAARESAARPAKSRCATAGKAVRQRLPRCGFRNRMLVAKYGEKSYSRCTSRRGRNSALKIIRTGLEKPVAVYSICGVKPGLAAGPGRPAPCPGFGVRKSATGPAESAADKPPSAPCRTVEMVPGYFRQRGQDQAVGQTEGGPLICSPRSCWVSGSNRRMKAVGKSPSSTQATVRMPMPTRMEGAASTALARRVRCGVGPER